MHDTAMLWGKRFFECYSKNFIFQDCVRVVEIGSQDVNGSLKDACPKNFQYTGVDFVQGNGVDLILDDPYKLPFENSSVDIVVSSSCFEHSEMFWLTFLEIIRILKPRGLLYLSAPSNGPFHRYPVDCWRFYPDSGTALVVWAKRNNMNVALLESFISRQQKDGWNDFVAVFLRDEAYLKEYDSRMASKYGNYYNGKIKQVSELAGVNIDSNERILNFQLRPEDQMTKIAACIESSKAFIKRLMNGGA